MAMSELHAKTPAHADSEAGFTLVEVIVALAILSLGIGGLLGMISTSLQQIAAAARLTEARSLAQSLLARVGADLPISLLEQAGELPNGYRWTLKASAYGDPKQHEEWPIGAYRVSAEVEWLDSGSRRAFSLETLRLGPKVVRP